MITYFVGVGNKFAVKDEGKPNEKDNKWNQDASRHVSGGHKEVVELNPAEYRNFDHGEQNS